MIASTLRAVADMVNNEKDEIFDEILTRAFNGFYNTAGWDVLTPEQIHLLEDAGFTVSVGKNKQHPWFMIEW